MIKPFFKLIISEPVNNQDFLLGRSDHMKSWLLTTVFFIPNQVLARFY